jgi:hypothetical protein
MKESNGQGRLGEMVEGVKFIYAFKMSIIFSMHCRKA